MPRRACLLAGHACRGPGPHARGDTLVGCAGTRRARRHAPATRAPVHDQPQRGLLGACARSRGTWPHASPHAERRRHSAGDRAGRGVMATEAESTANDLQELLDYLNRARGFDFSGYKKTTLSRRIEKRMDAVQAGTFSEYQDYLEVNPASSLSSSTRS